MSNLYEYKHGIINKNLAITDDGGNVNKKFDTLNDWYKVIQDYEFQARCPIILKNSHRNKHFTFACHLKSCQFKILLSYCGSNKESVNGGVSSGSVVDSANASGGEKDIQLEDNDGIEEKEDDVTAAIVAAVAAVNNNNNSPAGSSVKDDKQLVLDSYEDKKNELRGPFIVTKIDPYHNHPLESNLSLQKFVLTKIPKILQNELNFDAKLEELCNEEENTISKFKVAQFVENSDLLNVLRKYFKLTDNDIDKKFKAQIARRVTTYKARFVLKKKKNGEYQTNGISGGVSSNGSGVSARSSTSGAVKDSSRAHIQGSPTLPLGNNVHSQAHTDEEEHQDVYTGNDSLDDDTHLQTALKEAQKVVDAANAIVNEDSTIKNTKNNKRPLNENDNDNENDQNENPDFSNENEHDDSKINDLENENSNVHPDLEEEDLQRKRQRINSDNNDNNSIKLSALDESLISLEDAGDDKLPHEVAEQLRLLSSHFKDEIVQQQHHDELIKKDDIPDENIQPELRGQ